MATAPAPNRTAEKQAALTQKAVAALQAGRTSEAERLFRRAAGMKPPQAQSLYNMGVFLRRDGRAGQAVRWFKQALTLQPGHRDAWVELGLAHLEEDAIPGAVEVLTRALELNPGDDTALSALATAQFRSGGWRAACHVLENLRKHRDWTAEEALLHLRTLLECHEIDKALEESRRLGKAHPDISGELLSALTRRASGRLPLDEGRLAALLGRG